LFDALHQVNPGLHPERRNMEGLLFTAFGLLLLWAIIGGKE
jgi:hypothetical protein